MTPIPQPDICPECHGAGKLIGETMMLCPGGRIVRDPPCYLCSETGKVNAAWIAAGKRMREERLARLISLTEEARRRGMKASELSDMEHGRVEPR